MIELYDHQKEAVARLRNGNILVGDVGSGKSATSIAYYIQRESTRDLYIITTAKKRDSMDWEDELIEFRLGLNPEYNKNNVKITIDSWNNIHKYQRVIGAFFIFDEQRVIGKGAWVKSFLRIARANHWILLSATPGDTYEDYIPVFVANGFYRNRTEFLQQHAVYNPYTPYRKIEDFVDKRRLNFYRHQIVVRMKDTRQTKRIPVKVITDYDKTLYKTIWKDRWNPYDNEPITTAANVCYLLRRVVNSDQSRINKLHELLEQHPKVIIFYNYDYELEILHNNLTLWNIPYSEWNGHRHEEIVTGERWVYLVQYSAGAEAWNCIETNVIIFYSQTYSYKTKEQASGRIDRMNTPFHELYYYNMTSFAPIDIAISRSLQMKQNFNERLFVGDKR